MFTASQSDIVTNGHSFVVKDISLEFDVSSELDSDGSLISEVVTEMIFEYEIMQASKFNMDEVIALNNVVLNDYVY